MARRKMFRTVGDLMELINEATERLAKGEIDPKNASVMARNFGVQTTLIGHRIKHARATNRLAKGSSVIPDAKLE